MENIEQQLAEAEERGYRRGLNEQIEQKMQEPSTWETPDEKPEAQPEVFQILANPPHSIWE